jgi:hypothetical protein
VAAPPLQDDASAYLGVALDTNISDALAIAPRRPRCAEGREVMRDDYIHPLSINGQLMKKDARIAELEAVLKDLREAARGVDQDEMHYSQRDEWEHYLAKADEVLNGEKIEN